MKIAFRADASLQMGSGHVMRCLTLADALREQGAQCHFISRAHPGHLMEVIRQRGYMTNWLVAPVQQSQAAIKNIATAVPDAQPNQQPEPFHAAWLGNTWQTDATDTAAVLASLQPDWLVVDHYALDQRWEEAVAPHYKKLMVIDDLADRAHLCDVLLDQNLGRQQQDYAKLVPARCQVFTGPQYALLRPEFATLRAYSLQRRLAQIGIGKLLITMGGVDQDNATGQVLQALKTCALPANCRITVVMGLTAPWLQKVQELASQMPWPTDVQVNVNDMAQRMADSDLAIGAAGSSSWERCCLGLPTLMVVLADNQREAATHLQNSGSAHCFALNGSMQEDLKAQLQSLVNDPAQLSQMATCARAITNGLGVDQVVTAITATLNNRD
ncbi:MAG: UDP-2,4-diacetamido-2,4,6-trideoxy-beta-L-altropyranose hydrolase [Rhodoferax ferrireducens]|uniref:UDP-2,4-diacetamido-2,4, 6-trideoxy-beta-L-altropyranose hydrolase n=2 Tax=Pseudomonadota TaxID=1224 RepID=A0A1Y1QYS0_9GAMM|nr:MAG: UDP-2,4-diacetamido-2,4,6-trideoxy-beta-L-altropyranose hydrolase [Rhodoferax ferrireducens]OQX16866.1 MAG: UDP-2,4-diacetamido-2,4,6-trideoxy-beta-L-altropyranose hydrolase [Thiothrix lacustris]